MPASNGSTKITPLSCLLPLPLPPEQGRSLEPLPLSCPGGAAPGAGHGFLTLAALGGFGFGVGLGFGVGRGVAATGFGVGFGVTRGVGAGVTRGVGAAVAAGVPAGVGAAVTAGVGPAVLPGAGAGVTTGTKGDPEARAAVGDGLAEGDGLASIDGDGLVGGGSEADPAGVDVGPGVSAAGVASGTVGLAVGITATTPLARADAAACCWSSTPPMPRAMVASTRFRTPRPRIRRTR